MQSPYNQKHIELDQGEFTNIQQNFSKNLFIFSVQYRYRYGTRTVKWNGNLQAIETSTVSYF